METKYIPYKFQFLKNIEQIQNLLIVVAMESEEKAILQGVAFEERVIGQRTQISIKEFTLSKCMVRVARSGVGLVNAGVLFTLLAEHVPIDAIILLGVGGALDEKLNAGDVVVSRQIIQHDSISSHASGNLFIASGELTISLPPDQQVDPMMKCDPILVDWVKCAVEKSGKGQAYLGTILSGSEFAASFERKKDLRGLANDALLVDMEAAALAQIARKLKIPFVAAKTVADRAKPASSVSDDYLDFLDAAAAHSGGLLNELLKTFGI